MKVFIETRIDGLPWTREGCNAWQSPTRKGWAEWTCGHFLPYESREAAEAALEALKQQDDPMWRRAEYRFVPATALPKTKVDAYRFLQAHGAGFLANVVLTRHREPARRLKALCRLIHAGHAVDASHASDDDGFLVDGYLTPWGALDNKTAAEIGEDVRRQHGLSVSAVDVATEIEEP